MNRLASLLAAGCFVAAAGIIGASPASAAVSTQDSTWLTANEHTNLAEQAIGTLAMQKGQDPATAALAKQTVSDHKTAQGKATAVAKQVGVTLPTAPNATQQSQAAQLQAAPSSDFDLMYAQIQVAGHELSISQTQTEISSGSDADIVAYAKYYLPVAQMHLQMAQSEVSALGGNPNAVPAGTGGLVATGHADDTGWQIGLGAGIVLALAGGGVLVLSRRRSARV